jgi:hypothetical protein
MKCDDVRSLLPELAEGVPRAVGPAEVHLASCASCARELASYRMVLLELASLRDETVEPAPELLGRLLEQVPEAARPGLLRRMASDDRVQYAAFSLGGAVVGATAIGLLWWRARRTLSPDEPGASSASG